MVGEEGLDGLGRIEVGRCRPEEERADELGGLVTVSPGTGRRGCCVAATIPVRAAAAATPRRPEPAEAFPTLTPSEMRVLEKLANGHNNAVIADLLGYSPKTVRNYVSIILAKLQVEDRTHAILAARHAGIHLDP